MRPLSFNLQYLQAVFAWKSSSMRAKTHFLVNVIDTQCHRCTDGWKIWAQFAFQGFSRQLNIGSLNENVAIHLQAKNFIARLYLGR